MGSPEKVSAEKKDKKTDVSLRPNGQTATSIAVKAKVNNKIKLAGKETGRFSFKPSSKIMQTSVKRLGATKRERTQVSPGEREEVPKKVSLQKETGKSKDTESEVAGSQGMSKVSAKEKGSVTATSPSDPQAREGGRGERQHSHKQGK